MSVVQYTLDHCTKCLKCIKACKSEAIYLRNERVIINEDRCIMCGKCIVACANKGLHALGGRFEEFDSFDKTFVLVPSALYSVCNNLEEVGRLMSAIKRIGFDELIDLSDIDGALYRYEQKQIATSHARISPICPSINRLIQTKYPLLSEHIFNIEDAATIKAKQLRIKYPEQKIGIYYLSECCAKLKLGRIPYGKGDEPIDVVLGLSEMFPLIKARLSSEWLPIDLCADGLKRTMLGKFQQEQMRNTVVSAVGLEQAEAVFDLLEYDLLKDTRYVMASLCINGCIGGNMLWGNPFTGQNHVEMLLKECKKPIAKLTVAEMSSVGYEPLASPQQSMEQRIIEFEAVNKILEQLPNYDCGACGFQLCSTLATEIYRKKATLNDCLLYRGGKNAG
jgi:Na+-translocating ferredoxin:NAD+ oxidoreductase RNF subunit RnfB